MEVHNAINRVLFRGRWSRLVQLLPMVLIMTFLFVIPLMWLFVVSLWRFNPSGVLSATDLTIENYLKFLTTPFYRNTIIHTLKLGLTTSSACLVLGYPLAYIFARSNMKHKNILMFILITPLFVSVVVRVFGWEIILGRHGLINYLLLALRIIDEPIRILETEFAVILGLVNVQLTFMVMPIYSSLESIRPSLEEAAQTLGANPVVSWLKVTLPLSVPGIMAGWTLVFMMSMCSYVQPSVLGGPSYFVMATVLRSQITGALNWPMASAMGFMLLIVGVLAVFLPVWIIRKTVAAKLEEGINRV